MQAHNVGEEQHEQEQRRGVHPRQVFDREHEHRDQEKRNENLGEQESAHEERGEDLDETLDALGIEAVETGNVPCAEEGDKGEEEEEEGAEDVGERDDLPLVLLQVPQGESDLRHRFVREGLVEFHSKPKGQGGC